MMQTPADAAPTRPNPGSTIREPGRKDDLRTDRERYCFPRARTTFLTPTPIICLQVMLLVVRLARL